jgi:hypothetical protein
VRTPYVCVCTWAISRRGHPDNHSRHLTCWRLHRGIGFASAADGKRAEERRGEGGEKASELPPSKRTGPPCLRSQTSNSRSMRGGGQCNDTTGVVYLYIITSRTYLIAPVAGEGGMGEESPAARPLASALSQPSDGLQRSAGETDGPPVLWSLARFSMGGPRRANRLGSPCVPCVRACVRVYVYVRVHSSVCMCVSAACTWLPSRSVSQPRSQ